MINTYTAIPRSPDRVGADHEQVAGDPQLREAHPEHEADPAAEQHEQPAESLHGRDAQQHDPLSPGSPPESSHDACSSAAMPQPAMSRAENLNSTDTNSTQTAPSCGLRPVKRNSAGSGPGETWLMPARLRAAAPRAA
jgi:hypothetical protein